MLIRMGDTRTLTHCWWEWKTVQKSPDCKITTGFISSNLRNTARRKEIDVHIKSCLRMLIVALFVKVREEMQ